MYLLDRILELYQKFLLECYIIENIMSLRKEKLTLSGSIHLDIMLIFVLVYKTTTNVDVNTN